jgi:hypothetical protein
VGEKVYDLRGSVEEPKIYLGSNISKEQLSNGSTAWAMSSDTYVKNMLNTVKEILKEKGKDENYGQHNDVDKRHYQETTSPN